VPVPTVLGSAAATASTRGFYVMEAVEGVVPSPQDVKSVIPDPQVRASLGRELGAIMARLHAADVTQMPLLSDAPAVDGTQTGAVETAEWAQVYDDNARVRIPILDLAVEWLAARADHVSGRVALVHNDLRVGNVIVHDGHVAAVLDWETAHFSDPAADIAWFCMQTFRGRSPLVGRLLTMPELLDAYEAVAGWRPSAQSVTYWTVLSFAKAAISNIQALQAFTGGHSQDMRYANMSHSIYYNLAWLADMLAADDWGT
jgi:aminoglycoside phosphotransferase (APT) family kinase protein